MGEFVDWVALGQILFFGVLLGAGLPAVYALGVRSLDAAASLAGGAATARKIGAYACFAVIIIAILVALAFIANRGH